MVCGRQAFTAKAAEVLTMSEVVEKEGRVAVDIWKANNLKEMRQLHSKSKKMNKNIPNIRLDELDGP